MNEICGVWEVTMAISGNSDKGTRDWAVRKSSPELRNLNPQEKAIVEQFLTEFPVKLGALAGALGVKVLKATLPRGISGEISYTDNHFQIRVNRHEPKHRQRFTLAHEIAHFLLHRDRIMNDGGWSENVLLRSGQPMQIEYEANRLASDLVMPSDLLELAISEYSGPLTDEIIDDLAARFGVSKAAMEIKLQTV